MVSWVGEVELFWGLRNRNSLSCFALHKNVLGSSSAKGSGWQEEEKWSFPLGDVSPELPAVGQGYEVTSVVVSMGAGGVCGFFRTALMHLEPQVAFEMDMYSVFWTCKVRFCPSGLKTLA